MTNCALLLRRTFCSRAQSVRFQIRDPRPAVRNADAFCRSPVLMVARLWNWDTPHAESFSDGVLWLLLLLLVKSPRPGPTSSRSVGSSPRAGSRATHEIETVLLAGNRTASSFEATVATASQGRATHGDSIRYRRFAREVRFLAGAIWRRRPPIRLRPDGPPPTDVEQRSIACPQHRRDKALQRSPPKSIGLTCGSRNRVRASPFGTRTIRSGP